jgi:hypothetical protein
LIHAGYQELIKTTTRAQIFFVTLSSAPEKQRRSRRSLIDIALAGLLGPCKNCAAGKKLPCTSQRKLLRARSTSETKRGARGWAMRRSRSPEGAVRSAAGLRAEEAPEGGLCSEAAQPKGTDADGALIKKKSGSLDDSPITNWLSHKLTNLIRPPRQQKLSAGVNCVPTMQRCLHQKIGYSTD